MIGIYTPNRTDAAHLAKVKTEMAVLAAFVIHVIDFLALEGSHRLAGAYELGLVPQPVVHSTSDEGPVSGFDGFGNRAHLSDEGIAGARDVVKKFWKKPRSIACHDFEQVSTRMSA